MQPSFLGDIFDQPQWFFTYSCLRNQKIKVNDKSENIVLLCTSSQAIYANQTRQSPVERTIDEPGTASSEELYRRKGSGQKRIRVYDFNWYNSEKFFPPLSKTWYLKCNTMWKQGEKRKQNYSKPTRGAKKIDRRNSLGAKVKVRHSVTAARFCWLELEKPLRTACFRMQTLESSRSPILCLFPSEQLRAMRRASFRPSGREPRAAKLNVVDARHQNYFYTCGF